MHIPFLKHRNFFNKHAKSNYVEVRLQIKVIVIKMSFTPALTAVKETTLFQANAGSTYHKSSKITLAILQRTYILSNPYSDA